MSSVVNIGVVLVGRLNNPDGVRSQEPFSWGSNTLETVVSGLTVPLPLFHRPSRDSQHTTCGLTDVPSGLPDQPSWRMSPNGSTLHLKIYPDGDTVYLHPSSNVLRQRGKKRELRTDEQTDNFKSRWMDWKVDRCGRWINSCNFLWDLNGNTYVVIVETRSVFPTVPVGSLNVANYAVVSPNVITQMNAELSASC